MVDIIKRPGVIVAYEKDLHAYLCKIRIQKEFDVTPEETQPERSILLIKEIAEGAERATQFKPIQDIINVCNKELSERCKPQL